MPFGLPLVSVIIVNFNYGHFLRDAVNSVVGQTYRNIECIIVDDASTDESGDRLHEIEAMDAGVTIIRRTENGGQSLATQQGFAASAGEYVVFLDADDYLLPNFVETHVFVHLSLRIPVGFSSSDMAEAKGTQIVVTTSPNFAEFIRSKKGRKADLFRQFDKNAPELWPSSGTLPDLEERLHLVEPGFMTTWVWSPTSGNCFRRDALQLFLDNDDLGSLRSCTDAYLIRGVSVLTGSVLIDRTLSVYRVHGTNAFARHAHLNGLLHYARGAGDNDNLGRKLVIDHFVAKADLFGRRVHSPLQFITALKALNDAWPRMPAKVKGCRSYLAGKMVTDFARLENAVGLRNLLIWMLLSGVPPWQIVQAYMASRRKAQSSACN